MTGWWPAAVPTAVAGQSGLSETGLLGQATMGCSSPDMLPSEIPRSLHRCAVSFTGAPSA